MKNYKNLISDVINKDLCCYCGTCEGVCPENVIALSHEGIKGTGKCTNCQICYESCPGRAFDYQFFTKELFNSSNFIDQDIGSYNNIYKGYSTNKILRNKASSGGVATAVLEFLLRKKIIDGAIVVGSKDKNNFNSEALLANNKSTILEASQSKYITIPTNKLLKNIKNKKGRFAFMGLPCQIQGVRKAEKNNTELKSKIVIHIGLFCGFNLYPDATLFLLNKLGIAIDDVETLDYRGGTEQTGFHVVCKNGEDSFIKKHAYTFLNLFYSPARCWKCYDLTSEFADISVGDAWEKDNEGWSRIITRNKISDNLIENMVRDGSIQIEESDKKDIQNTQSHLIKYKKRWFWVRYHKFINRPIYNIKNMPPLTVKEKIMGNIFYFIHVLAVRHLSKRIIYFIPLRLLTNISEFLRNFLKKRK
jgi:coenzyme F420 hydrogenase subunit beta